MLAVITQLPKNSSSFLGQTQCITVIIWPPPPIPPTTFPLFVFKQTIIRLQWSVLISSWKHWNGSEEKGINIPEIYLTQLNGVRRWYTSHLIKKSTPNTPFPACIAWSRVAIATPPCSATLRQLTRGSGFYCLQQVVACSTANLQHPLPPCIPKYNAGVRFNDW